MVRKIGVLTSGGDAPGMNAAIRAVTRIALNNGVEVVGVKNGYRGLLEETFIPMERSSVSDILDRGGTFLGSARLPEFRENEIQDQCVKHMHRAGIDALVVIGGDGSYRGALALTKKGINCIGLPGTIDNDIPGTDLTIGFDTALRTCVENVDKLRDTSSSHHRCSIVEVMGNHCGDLALYTAISCGAEMVITPETGYDEIEVLERLRYLGNAVRKNHAIVIISEKITDVEALAKKVSLHTYRHALQNFMKGQEELILCVVKKVLLLLLVQCRLQVVTFLNLLLSIPNALFVVSGLWTENLQTLVITRLLVG